MKSYLKSTRHLFIVINPNPFSSHSCFLEKLTPCKGLQWVRNNTIKNIFFRRINRTGDHTDDSSILQPTCHTHTNDCKNDGSGSKKKKHVAVLAPHISSPIHSEAFGTIMPGTMDASARYCSPRCCYPFG